MTPDRENPQHDPRTATVIEIRFRGHLDHYWTDWFDGLQVVQLETGETMLSGPIADQAALMGLLNKLNRLNLTILSVGEIPPEPGGSVLGTRGDPIQG